MSCDALHASVKVRWMGFTFAGFKKKARKKRGVIPHLYRISTHAMGGGMRDLDRAIGAISTLVVGIGILMVRSMATRARCAAAASRESECWSAPRGLKSVVPNDTWQVRELFREKDGQSKWEKYTSNEEGTDVYFQYGMVGCDGLVVRIHER